MGAKAVYTNGVLQIVISKHELVELLDGYKINAELFIGGEYMQFNGCDVSLSPEAINAITSMVRKAKENAIRQANEELNQAVMDDARKLRRNHG